MIPAASSKSNVPFKMFLATFSNPVQKLYMSAPDPAGPASPCFRYNGCKAQRDRREDEEIFTPS